MVYCEHCGRTDGCGYQDFHGATVCLRCYRAARDREFEERQRLPAASSQAGATTGAQPQKSSGVKSLFDRLLKRG